MPDIVQFGVEIKSEGADKVESDFKKIGSAAEKAAKKTAEFSEAVLQASRNRKIIDANAFDAASVAVQKVTRGYTNWNALAAQQAVIAAKYPSLFGAAAAAANSFVNAGGGIAALGTAARLGGGGIAALGTAATSARIAVATAATAFSSAAGGIASIGRAAATHGGGIVALGNATNLAGRASIFAGGSFSKFRAEAITLFREIITGTVSMRTIGALIGSLGTTILPLALAAFAAFEIGIRSLRSAWDGLKESIREAAHEQDIALTFRNVAANAAIAETALSRLSEFAKGAGIFNKEELEREVISLKALGAETRNAVTYTEALAAGSAHVGVSVTEMGHAFQSVMIGRIQNPTLAQKAILEAVAVSTKTKFEQVIANIRDGTISAHELTDAIVAAYREGGIWADSISKRQETYNGQIAILNERWREFKIGLGTPIVDTLSPILESWTKKLGDSESAADKWGNRIATWIDTANKGMNALVFGVGKLNELFDKMPLESLLSGKLFGAGASGEAEGSLAGVRSGRNIAGPRSKLPINPGDDFFKRSGGTAGGSSRHSEWDRYKSDIDQINKYWEDYHVIMAKAMSDTERQRRLEDLAIDTSKQLYDPSLFRPYLGALDRLIAKEAEHERQMKSMEQRIKTGAASIGDSFKFGIQRAVDAAGNLKQQVADIGTQITNDLASGFGNAFTAIVTGTKSAKDAFREMALSIINDLIAMIIKMLIFRAISSLIGGIGGAYGNVSGIQDVGAAAGGGVVGHNGPQLTLTGEKGREFVFDAESTRNIGIDNLYAMMHAGRKGGATTTARAGRERQPAIPPPGWTVRNGVLIPPSLPQYEGSNLTLSGSEPPAIGTYPHEPNAGGLLGPFGPGWSGGRGSYTRYDNPNNVPIWETGTNLPTNENVGPNPGLNFRYGTGANIPPNENVGPTPGLDLIYGQDNPRGAMSGPQFSAFPDPNWRSSASSGNVRITNTNVVPIWDTATQDNWDANARTLLGGGTASNRRYGGIAGGLTGGPSFGNIAGSGSISFNRVLPNGTVMSTGPGGGGLGNPPVNYMGQAGLFHSGGIVGMDGIFRLVDMRLFETARRMHSGGIAGDEEAVIAKRGEIIATPDQWANHGSSGGTSNTNVALTININNNGTGQSSKSERSTGDAEGAKDLARVITPQIEKWANKESLPGGRLYRRN